MPEWGSLSPQPALWSPPQPPLPWLLKALPRSGPKHMPPLSFPIPPGPPLSPRDTVPNSTGYWALPLVASPQSPLPCSPDEAPWPVIQALLCQHPQLSWLPVPWSHPAGSPPALEESQQPVTQRHPPPPPLPRAKPGKLAQWTSFLLPGFSLLNSLSSSWPSTTAFHPIPLVPTTLSLRSPLIALCRDSRSQCAHWCSRAPSSILGA